MKVGQAGNNDPYSNQDFKPLHVYYPDLQASENRHARDKNRKGVIPSPLSDISSGIVRRGREIPSPVVKQHETQSQKEAFVGQMERWTGDCLDVGSDGIQDTEMEDC